MELPEISDFVVIDAVALDRLIELIRRELPEACKDGEAPAVGVELLEISNDDLDQLEDVALLETFKRVTGGNSVAVIGGLVEPNL